jgi:hypothetical protein
MWHINDSSPACIQIHTAQEPLSLGHTQTDLLVLDAQPQQRSNEYFLAGI